MRVVNCDAINTSPYILPHIPHSSLEDEIVIRNQSTTLFQKVITKNCNSKIPKNSQQFDSISTRALSMEGLKCNECTKRWMMNWNKIRIRTH